MSACRLSCPCGVGPHVLVFTYDAPPDGETRFALSGSYRRELLRCAHCGHFVSRHELDLRGLYEGDYVESTYGDDLPETFERIVSLPPGRSDNHARVERVLEFMGQRAAGGERTALDVGSGLGVFLHALRSRGWTCTAVDPDARAVEHAREAVGVDAIQADYLVDPVPGRFELVSFNKVLEHVADPIAMLRRAHANLDPQGVVYVEVPDGESAVLEGPSREEFFIEHLHVFSSASLALTVRRAGFLCLLLARLREPSTKFTLFAFLSADPGAA